MDILPLLLTNQASFYEDTLIEAAAALSVVLILGDEAGCVSKATRRNPSHLYLRCPQLLPNPRLISPWQQLYESVDAYITIMGVDIDTFHYILSISFDLTWNTTPIPRNDTFPVGLPRLNRRSLDGAHYTESQILTDSLGFLRSPAESVRIYDSQIRNL
jgi:hypothetical protein